MISVAKGELARRLDPHLEFGVGRNDGQRRNVQLELFALGEFAKAGSGRNELFFANHGGEAQQVFTQIVHSVLVDAKHVGGILAIDQESVKRKKVEKRVRCQATRQIGRSLDVASNVVGQLFEKSAEL